MKTKFLTILILLCVLYCNCLTAYSYSRTDVLEIKTYNFKNNSIYIELLINMSYSDEFYTDYNKENMKQYDFNINTLKNYRDNEGYISFSCHYKDVLTEMKIKKLKFNDEYISRNFFTLKKYESTNMIGQDIYIMKDLYDKKRNFKIAVLDKDGKIIQVSEPFEITNNKHGYIASEIDYNMAENKYSFNWSHDFINVEFTIENKPLFICIIIFLISSILFLIYRKRIQRKSKFTK